MGCGNSRQGEVDQAGDKSSRPLKLGYWAIRGRGQQLRLILNHFKAQFEDVRYGAPGVPDWFKEDKFNLGLPFPNLPYIIDGSVKITEANACFKYICRKLNKQDYIGKTWQDQVKLDSIFGVVEDCYMELQEKVFSTDEEEEFKKLFSSQTKFHQKLTQLNDFLGDKPCLMGYWTFEDFHIYGLLDLITLVTTKLHGQSQLSHFSNLERLYQILRSNHQEFFSKPENSQIPFYAPYLCKLKV